MGKKQQKNIIYSFPKRKGDRVKHGSKFEGQRDDNQNGLRGALSQKLESPCYSYGARPFDDVPILQRKKDETLGSPTPVSIIGMYVTIYVTVAPPPVGVSFVSLSQASTSPFATIDSEPVRMDSACISSQPDRVLSCWVSCFYFI
ncbi:uncharacterized protein TNCV_4494961 [Trichonephila clavipes]|nr:uncharacterized protein TNCV_4494961 [Trichonephila clavipes]